MAELTGAQLTLLTTPTGGSSGEHSPYYRRLLSSGYKGYLQGTVGGATLYGTIGAGIGGALALATGAWVLVPVIGVLGLLKGAETFGHIGSMAAISAETAETSERRRYLLDRYYSLPNDPAYAEEAHQIQRMLTTQHETHPPLALFHWKTMFTCALLGAAILGSLVALSAFPAVAPAITPLLGAIGLTHLGIALSTGIGAGLGGLIGGVMGLDRYYVRKWFDGTESLLSDGKGRDREIAERAREVEKLESLSPDRDVPKQTIKLEVREPSPGNGPATITNTGSGNGPSNKVSTVHLDSRVAGIQLMDRLNA